MYASKSDLNTGPHFFFFISSETEKLANQKTGIMSFSGIFYFVSLALYVYLYYFFSLLTTTRTRGFRPILFFSFFFSSSFFVFILFFSFYPIRERREFELRERWEIGREREGRKREDPAGGLATGHGGRHRRAGRPRPCVGDVTRGVFRQSVWYPYRRKPIFSMGK
jgi:hypothetical protein